MNARSLAWLVGLGFAIAAAACGDDLAPGAGGADGGVGEAGDSGAVADGQAEGDSGPVVKPGPPGTLDTKFGKDGVTSWPLPPNAPAPSFIDLIRTATQQDGKVVFAFSARNSPTIFVTRLDEIGKADPSFGTGGTQTTTLVTGGIGSSYVTATAVQPDGKLLVVALASPTVGTATVSPKFATVVVRYLPSGALDGSFNAGGIFTAALSTSDYPSCVALQPDGKILVGGGCNDGTTGTACILRLTSSGARDASFGNNGLVDTPLTNSYEQVSDLHVLPDGRLLAAANTYVPTNVGSSGRYMAIRYASDGSVDTSFGSGGSVTTAFDSVNRSNDQLSSILVRGDGSFVLAGNHSLVEVPAVKPFGFTKITSDGALDTTYGNDGHLTLDPGSTVYVPRTVATGSDMVSLGVHVSTASRSWLTKVKSNGVIDATFGKEGFAEVFEGKLPQDLARPVSQRVHVVGLGADSVSVARFWL